MQAQCPDRFAGLRMLVLGAALLAATLPGALLVAEEARPVAQWVEAIRAEAKGEGADPQTQLLRLGAGVYITHRYHGGGDLKTYRYPEAVVALREFMAGPGRGTLGKIVSGEELNGDEARHRLIVHALTEAGQMISKMAAPCIGVEEALELIGARPIALASGQELPADLGDAFDVIRQDVERHPANPRLLFGYTGMEWRKEDRPAIRDLRQRVDRLWQAWA